MKRSPQEGSALLISLLLLTCIILWCMNTWRTTAFMVDLVLQKQEHEICFYAVQGVMHQLIHVAQKNFELLCENAEIAQKKARVLSMHGTEKSIYTFHATLQLKDKNIFLITVTGFTSDQGCKCSMQCELESIYDAATQKTIYKVSTNAYAS